MKRVILIALFAAFAVDASAAPTPAGGNTRYVLLLHSYDHEFGPFDTFASVFRTELNRLSLGPIVFLEVSLGRNPEGARSSAAPLMQYLNATFAGQRLDLVVPIGGPAALFAQQHRKDLFPTTPVVYAAVDTRFLQSGTWTPRDTAVSVVNDPVGLLRVILQLRPTTTHVMVVTGSSPLEQAWKAESLREFKPFANRLTFEWTDQYSFAQLCDRAASLSPDWAILYVLYSVDVTGGPYTESQVLRRLHAVAKAPIFGFHSTQLGSGIVGGPLMPIPELAQSAVNVTLRVLRGEDPSSIRPAPQRAGIPTFDWRELQRWKIDEKQLPPGSIVRFRQLSLWQQYSGYILAGAAVFCLQTLLVLLLIMNRLRRRRIELALRESEARFRLLANSAPVMIWIAGPDGRCTDFNRTWLHFTGRSIADQCGDGWTDGVYAADKERCLGVSRNAIKNREPFERDYRLRRRDGQYRWIFDCGVPRFDPSGTYAGYVGSAIDITDQKLAKSTLADLNIKLLEAQEAERARLARELHDDLAQRTSGLSMVLRGLVRRLSRESAAMTPEFDRLCDEFSQLTRDIASLSRQLHPAPLELFGLAGAAEALCHDMSERSGIDVEFSAHDIPRNLPKPVELGLFRVVQEALNNVAQHATAQYVKVTIRRDGDLLRISVADDGSGFDTNDAAATEGIGLITMRERMSLLSGELHVESQPTVGTVIMAVAPFNELPAGELSPYSCAI